MKNFAKFDKLMERVKTQASIRNRIVHGTWMMVIKVHRHKYGTKTGRTSTWVRWYQPSGPELLQRMMGPPKNNKLLADYHFSVQRIGQLAEAAYILGKEFQALAGEFTLQPYQAAQPIKRA